MEYEDARFTGRTKRTKLGWTKEALERMHALMIDVVWHQVANGEHFNNIFQEEMIKRYNKEKDNTRYPGGREHDEEIAQENWVVHVYNEFNIGRILAHAAMDTTIAGGVAAIGQQQQGNGKDDEVLVDATPTVQL